MQNVITAQVLGGRRFDIEGNKMASLFVAQASKEGDENNIGLEVMKIGCPYALFDTIKPGSLPGEFELQVNIKPGAGGKIAMEAIALRPVTKPGHQPISKAS